MTVSHYLSSTEFAVNSFVSANQTAPAIARFADGGFIIAWGTLDTTQDGDSSAIKAQRFDAAGNMVGAEFLVNSAATGSQFTPVVATLANGNFVIAWTSTDATQDGSGYAIKAQLYDAAGVPIGSEYVVNSSTAGSQSTPNVTSLASGGFVVSWDDSTGLDVRARLFGSDGAPLGADFVMNNLTTASQGYGDITALAGGGFVATWRTTDTTQDGSGDALKARIFDANGVAIGGEFRVNTAGAGYENAGTATALSNGNFVIAWKTTDTTQDGSSSAIKAQIFSATGVKLGGEFLVNTAGVGQQSSPVVTDLADGGFLVSWETFDTTQDGSGGAIKAQVFDANGVKVGSEFLVNGLTTGGQFLPDMVTLADGRVVISWVSESGDGNGYAVRARFLSANSAPEVSNTPMSVAEGDVIAGTVSVTDVGGPSALVYSISGGADAALFTIDAATGQLSFITAPDFEAPVDGDGDNVYQVNVTVSDGELATEQNLSVSVTNVNEAVSITSDGGGEIASLAMAENQSLVTLVTAEDVDGDAVSFAIAGGADAALFSIDAVTGALSFAAAPDHEAPADAGADNVYDVIISASDGSLVDNQQLSITITNQNEGLAITSFGGGAAASLSMAENGAAVSTITAVDVDGDAVTYAIAGGADASLFSIDAATGALSFIAAPNFESPADAGGNNIYDVIVSATDGSFVDSQALAITVTNVVEGATITGTSTGNTISTTQTVAGQAFATQLEDVIFGLGGNDAISSAGGNDTLDGGTGNDVLTGGAGADLLIGGTGADRFTLLATSESTFASMDVITDFARAQGDKIYLNAIDARTNVGGNQAFTFIGTSAFSGTSGQLRYDQSGGNSFVMGDVNGDMVADFRIQVNGLISFIATDFVL